MLFIEPDYQGAHASSTAAFCRHLNCSDVQRGMSVDASQIDLTSKSLLSTQHLRDWREKGYLILRADEWLIPEEQKNLAIWMEEVSLLHWITRTDTCCLQVQNWPEKAFHWMKYFEKSAQSGNSILNRVSHLSMCITMCTTTCIINYITGLI